MPLAVLIALIKSLRPTQWTKNGLLFVGYIFSIQHGHSLTDLLRVIASFAIFCGASGSIYLINDVVDREQDRLHPRKRERPIASGALPVPVAVIAAGLLMAGGVWTAFLLNTPFGILTLGYIVLTLSYSAGLKRLVIIDVLALTGGFVIRAVAGAKVIDVPISSWLLLCATLLALFLGLAKRRGELVSLDLNGANHRKTLAEYTIPMLDQMLGVTASSTLMAYCLYTFTAVSVVTGKPNPAMMLTVPFVVYGLFRYLFLIHAGSTTDSPELVLLKDKPMLFNMVLYVIVAFSALMLTR